MLLRSTRTDCQADDRRANVSGEREGEFVVGKWELTIGRVIIMHNVHKQKGIRLCVLHENQHQFERMLRNMTHLYFDGTEKVCCWGGKDIRISFNRKRNCTMCVCVCTRE